MALKKQDKNPVEIDETLQEQQYIDALVNKVSEAQKIYATYSQEQVDHIFRRVALKLSSLRIPLAKMAVEETGMGVVEDKVIKTTLLPNIFTTNSKTAKPAAFWKKTRPTAF